MHFLDVSVILISQSGFPASVLAIRGWERGFGWLMYVSGTVPFGLSLSPGG